ncbi:NitT/TauT family transport system permease protein [Methylobacterium sp. PvP062]|jgi:NitT/TauT family transport system permease protein|uniref:NitT/TauT family transport system permease protein n=1 Tax=Methylobacterium radiotolerans TaxID=31998 RepID=A0ABV2N8X0_9HYPH|nr:MULTISPECIES: ABC transporter permease [Methylobacterium]MCX7336200.1 ABC transporter permease [Hyphomicrobiales bacterium]GAN50750.1 ABC transporter permease [Methylobacterium sp. ME121]KZC02483.1 putative aliphatic sulfonates transport permease protein SsuC [Methylobacterium radiotolerans]MBN6821858.1 ABC transporter permease [Methylobacterium organophilum]MBP2493820.1 NitT/TauT family transport system permease protein [Methylobacterium sp. PvP105]
MSDAATGPATVIGTSRDAPPAPPRDGARLRSGALVLLVQIALLAALLAAWEWQTRQSPQSSFLFGSPSAISRFLWQGLADGTLLRDAGVTALETGLGFLIGNIVGTLAGLSLWYSTFVSRVVQPFIVAIGSIPIIALAPIIIIWFGTGLASKVAMSTLSVVVVALVTSYKGALGVDPDQINLMRTLGARKPQIFAKLVVPSSLADIFAGLKLTVGFALIGAIVGEFMSSSVGLGHAIFQAGSLYAIPKVFAALVGTIALALILTFLVGRAERLLMPWRDRH